MRHNFFLSLSIIFLLFSCNSKSEKQNQNNSSSKIDYESTSPNYSEEEEKSEENSLDCKFEDNTYSATVDYNNPNTGYSSTYTLDVEVQDCQVIRINFPNDGYLDEDHISYADIDEDGNASVSGEDGKTYEIHIDE
jgi:hypothetical protein